MLESLQYYKMNPVEEKYDLMIAANPESQFVFMITHDDGKTDAIEDERIYGFYRDTRNIAIYFNDKYNLRMISVYGPKIYIDKVADEIEIALPQFTVNRIGV